ncbi:MAG: pyruvate formate lyase activating enzyme [Clostridiales bacterium]|nr:pyruvate formate lyase activating enzyme [Clostridiales bacterium]
MKEAMYYNKIEDKKVHCYLCPHNCRIAPGKVGICRVRENRDGILYSLNYGKVSSAAMDPIEKKPLYHFYPGSDILSVGSFGCNLTCSFCQNWSIAHKVPHTDSVTAEQLIKTAQEHKNCIGIAYTYNEPSIWYEYVYETAVKAKEAGLKNVLVTNGYISQQPLKDILPYIDAMNIDVKGFTNEYYTTICGGTLEEVKKTVEIAALLCHIEVTTLVVPDLNDSIREIRELSQWIAGINPRIPLHLTRYFPNYKMTDRHPTPVETLYKAREEAEKYLTYVHLGNVW